MVINNINILNYFYLYLYIILFNWLKLLVLNRNITFFVKVYKFYLIL